MDVLTGREKEVAKLLASGHNKDEIAQKLTISRRTVEHHLASARGKTGARNSLELAVSVALAVAKNTG